MTRPDSTRKATAKLVPASVTVATSGNSGPGSVSQPRPSTWRSSHGLRPEAPDDVACGFDVSVASADEVGDHAGPAGLVEGADRGAVVAVEVLAEDQVVVPGGVGLHAFGSAEAGPPSVGVVGEQGDQP